MKKFTLLLVGLLVLTSCVGRKQIEKQLHSGNYDEAISNALNKLKRNKHKKRKHDYVLMLQDAYYKVVSQNHNTINHLKKDGNPELYEAIFNSYLDLEARQNAIKAVLPLRIDNKNIVFKFNDYTTAIVDYRAKVSEYKYNTAVTLINSLNKLDNREAYNILNTIEAINPNYKDVRTLLNIAHHQGTDYVIVAIENNTHQILPIALENDLLNFNTYGLNDFWTVYHANTNENITYDYAMQLQLRRINVSPEHVFKTQKLRQKEIIDGWEYLLDNNGNVVKDSLGNDIKIDKIITAKARFFEFNQQKSTQVIAKVIYSDLNTNQVLESFPIDSEFIFKHNYASVRGDRRALTKKDKQLLKKRKLRFPSNEQMVFDTGEDLKNKLKHILNNYSLRG